ncbi:MAG: hypothetical protein M1356_11440 [Gammaproteobacteria bacterium]|nr:hypothetical protein [Gammaproteobacteria bacterium]
MKLIKLLATAAVCVAFMSGCASSGSSTTASNTVTAQPQQVSIPEYVEFLDNLHNSIQDGEPRQLTARELNQFNNIQDNLRALIGNRTDVEQMNSDERQRLFNLHERLQALVMGDDSQQVICRSERQTGSHMRTTRCVTRAQLEEERRRNGEFFDQVLGSGMAPLPRSN